MSELLVKKSSGAAETACCGSMDNGKVKGAELVGIKGGAATAAPACDGATAGQGETTREYEVECCVLCAVRVCVLYWG